MEAGGVAGGGGELLDSLSRLVQFVRGDTTFHKQKQGLRIGRLPFEHKESLFMRIRQLTGLEKAVSPVQAEFEIIGGKLPGFGEQSKGTQDPSPLVRHEAEVADGRLVGGIEPECVQVFDLGVVVVTGLELGVGALQVAILFGGARTTGSQQTGNATGEQQVGEFEFHEEMGFRKV